MPEMMQRNLLEWWWRYGGPRDFWVVQRDAVATLIKREKLQALDRAHFVFDDPVPVDSAPAGGKVGAREVAATIRWPRPFPGGLRIPHVHFRDEVFELDAQQWARFSAAVVAGFRARLEQAGAVSFPALMRLAGGMTDL